MDRVPVFYPSEAEVQSPEAERKLSMIDSQTMQYRGLYFLNVDGPFDGMEAQFIRVA